MDRPLLPPAWPHVLFQHLAGRVLAGPCLGCEAEGRDPLCPTCLAYLDPLPAHRCRRCQGVLSLQGECSLCRQNPGGVEGVFTIGTYAGSLRKLIRQLKYQARADLGLYLGGLLADKMRLLVDPGWLVVPVPIHPTRRRQRGYNQAELIAWQVARRLMLDYTPLALSRPTHGRPFYLRGRSDRWEEASAAFAGEPGRIKGRRILLVDDIMTSGATAWGAAGALRQAGASEVWLAVAARAALKAPRTTQALSPRAALCANRR
ncbi:MAG TPA: hypothetical protein V6D00_11980 [Pantanalinema sp.]